jgi:hypothetical protein
VDNNKYIHIAPILLPDNDFNRTLGQRRSVTVMYQ